MGRRHYIINGQRINNLRFTDDTALLASTQDELLELIRLVENESELLGLELNTSKTTIMIDRQHNNLPDLTQIDRFEVVNKYI